MVDEKILLEKARAGDREALSELLVFHEAACYSLALHLTGNATDAEDICQDALARAASRVTSDAVQKFRPWLLSIVVSIHHNWINSETARQQRERNYAMERDAIERAKSSESEIDQNELRKQLSAALKQLKESYRLPIVLHYEQGLSYVETATVLATSEGTVATNIRRGLDELRKLLARSGYFCLVPMITKALNEMPMANVPAKLTAFTKSLASGTAVASKTVGVGSSTITVVGGLALSWKLLMAFLLATTLIFSGFKVWKSWRLPLAPDVVEPSTTNRSPPTVFITPRDYNAWLVFDKLAIHGGPKVVMLGEGEAYLIVPSYLRFKSIDGKELIETVAVAHNFKVTWARGGRYAILYVGASDDEIELARQGLISPDASLRRKAAQLAKSLRDPRIVPLLVKAAKDVNVDVAQQAVISLRRMSWATVLALDETASNLVIAEMNSFDALIRAKAIFAMHVVDREKAFPFIEKALADRNIEARCHAISALGYVGGEKALSFIEKALADQNVKVREAASFALGRVGGEKAPTLLEQALADKSFSVRCAAAFALGYVGGEKALALLEKALADQSIYVRIKATVAIGLIGGEKALALIEKLLAKPNVDSLQKVIYAMSFVDSKKSFEIIENALADKDVNARCLAIYALSAVGGEKALTLLEKALADKDATVSNWAAKSLSVVEGEKPQILLEKALASKNISARRGAATTLATFTNRKKALTLIEKALADQDIETRCSAISSIISADMDDEKALALIEKALDDENATVRCRAISTLNNVIGENARDILLKQLTKEKDRDALQAIYIALKTRFDGDPKVESALKDFKLPEPLNPTPQSPQSQMDEF